MCDDDERIQRFIDEIDNVCSRHQLTISHEDNHGSFLVGDHGKKISVGAPWETLAASDDALYAAKAVAAKAHPDHPESTVRILVWSDGTMDLEQYITYGEDRDEYGLRSQLLRSPMKSFPIGDLAAGLRALERETWMDLSHQAPQDAAQQIKDLQGEVARLKQVEAMWSKECAKAQAYVQEHHLGDPGDNVFDTVRRDAERWLRVKLKVQLDLSAIERKNENERY